MRKTNPSGEPDSAGPRPESARGSSGDGRYAERRAAPGDEVVRAALEKLIRRMTSGWPRRGHNLLEFYCAEGYFLEMFWQSGFDVTGQDQSARLLSLARERLKNTAELTQAHPEKLPFDDRSFDYVACVSGLEFAPDPQALVREMFRLATRGVLLAFPCSWSLHGLGRLLGRRAGRRFFSPLRVSTLIRRADESGAGKTSWTSILLGPAWTWKTPGLNRLNFAAGPLPLGAVTVVRVDFNPPLGSGRLLVAGKRSLRRETAPSSLGRMGRIGRSEEE